MMVSAFFIVILACLIEAPFNEKIVKLEKLQEATINLVDLSSTLPQNVGLSKAPHNYYIQTYRINDDEIYVVGITSEGKANVIKHFGYSRYRIKDVK